MDLTSPIRDVVPSLDGPVLQALAGTTAPLPLTRVHRLAGAGSLSGVRKVLLRLVATGLAEEVPGGYLLNRDHVAAPAVEHLAGLRREVLRRLRDYARGLRPAPLLVGVFGSFARSDGDVTSDIDVLVVTRPAADGDRDDIAPDLSTTVQRWTGNECHVVTVTPDDIDRMRRAAEPILTAWNEDLVVILGDRSVLTA
ncbi:MAG: nucleotidyltransferase domain-containing protein [Kineosporiaceae bacterium]